MAAQNPVVPPKVADGKLRGFDLTGRRAIIYGAETSVGRALVETFREAGATVGVTSASSQGDALFALKKVAAGGPSEAVDLGNGTNVQVATKKLVKDLGGLDIAVVAPDTYLAQPLAKTSDADLATVISGNLTATYNAFRSASKELAGKTEDGRLLAVLSGLALRGLPNVSAYAAAQAGVIGLVRALSQELGGRGVTTNALVAGWMLETPGRGADEINDNLLQRYIPARRFGRPEDLALLAVYLCSNASGYVNGHVVSVDGGALKHL
jgi:NAD(P)-dependent dehydrogenase (short-subunit alcohol dehydrogenase family)